MPRLIDYASRWDFVLDSHDLLVFTHGIKSLTLADVAAGAGMSTATLRRLVPSLEALHVSSLRRLERRLGTRHLHRAPSDDPDERCRVTLLESLAISPLHRQDDVVRQAVSALAYDSERVAAAVGGHPCRAARPGGEPSATTARPDVEGDEAVLLTALIDGLNTALLAPQAPLDPATAERVLRTHLERLGRDFPPGA